MRVLNKHIIHDTCPDQSLAFAMQLAMGYGQTRRTLIFTRQSVEDMVKTYPEAFNGAVHTFVSTITCKTSVDRLTASFYMLKRILTERDEVLCIVMDNLCPISVKVVQGAVRKAGLVHDTYIEANIERH